MNNLLLLSGGTGSRFGESIPKQYFKNKSGKMLLIKSLENFSGKDFKNTIIVADKKFHTMIFEEIIKCGIDIGDVFFTENGITRHESIKKGLDKMGELNIGPDDFVFLQEAVRPFVNERIINELIEFNNDSPNVSAGIKPIVLFSHFESGFAKELIPKDDLIELQLPKRYNYRILNKFFDRNIEGEKVLDESQFLINAGYPIEIVKGSRSNIKITFIEDKSLLGSIE